MAVWSYENACPTAASVSKVIRLGNVRIYAGEVAGVAHDGMGDVWSLSVQTAATNCCTTCYQQFGHPREQHS